MSNFREWEIPPYREDESPDKTDFQNTTDRDGNWCPPIFLWYERHGIQLSNNCDNNESIPLTCPQDVDDLIARLQRAKADVFATPST